MLTKHTRALLFGASLMAATASVAEARNVPPIDAENFIALYYSDGSRPTVGLDEVNRKLGEIGVRVSQVPIPDDAIPILHASRTRAVTTREADELLRRFQLGRRELLAEIARAGRTPEMPRGGFLKTSEPGVAPYPKVYDMRSMDEATAKFIQRKFGRLHVNSSDAGVGIDEVMTIISGGPYTWFFVFKGDVVGKLRFGVVGDGNKAWRISYPGLVPHGGYFDARHGLVVAYAHGPESFVMRYEDPSVEGAATLNDNPWIDFDVDRPRLLDQPRQLQGAEVRGTSSAESSGWSPSILYLTS